MVRRIGRAPNSDWKPCSAIQGIELAHGVRASCEYSEVPSVTSETSSKVYVEEDGEMLGTLPAEITVEPDALTLLAPAR